MRERKETDLGVLHELVGGVHLGFLFSELFEQARLERRGKRGKRNLDFLDDALLLGRVGRLCIAVDLHCRLVLLFLHLFDICSLERHDAVEVEACLEFDAREVADGICGDTLGTKTCDPWVDATGQALRFGIRRLDVERAFAIKGQNFGGGYGVATGEDDELSVFVGIRLGAVPRDFDGVLGDVPDVELAYAEGGAEEGAGKGGPAGDGFVLVEGGEEGFSPEGSLYARADGRDTGCATDKLDGVDLVDGETRLDEGLLEREGDAIEDRGNKFFVLVTG